MNPTRVNIRFLPLVILWAIMFMVSFASPATASLFENRTGGFWNLGAGFARGEPDLNAELHRVYKTFCYDCAPDSLVAAKSVGNLFKNGQIFERTIKTSKGPVDVMAETVVKGKTLHLKDIAIFGRDSKPLTGLTKEVLKARRALMNDAKSAGFKHLRITGVRHPTASTSANPGKVIDMTIDLTK